MSEKKFSHNFARRDDDLPPRKIYPLPDYPQVSKLQPFDNSNSQYAENVPIAIDFGKTNVRFGMAGALDPFMTFPSISARYKNRKINKQSTFIGYDVFIDSTIKANMKDPFDGQLITNWDSAEKMFDYCFLHLGVDSQNFVNNPVIMNETLAPPLSQRTSIAELLYETYGVPSMALGLDSLFSYHQNNGVSGLVVGSTHDATNVIPVLNEVPNLNITKRINVGGHQINDFMRSLISLKYPYFPTRLNDWQIQQIVKDHCFVSQNFNNEINHTLDLDYLEDHNITIEAPFNEVIKEEKTEEQIKQDEIRRKENIKKLQAQAKIKRMEKMKLKQKDYEYYSNIRNGFVKMSKKEIIETIREAGFDDEEDLNKYLANLEKQLKKSKLIEMEDDEEEDENPENKYDFSILDVENSELSSEQLKEKRRLRLIKANIDSKQRAREEREEAKREAEELVRKDIELREQNLEGWAQGKRQRLELVVKRRKERIKLKDELGDRKSKASQQRMRNIASLADDGPSEFDTIPTKSKRRHNATIDNDPNDNFGANDDDWAVYRDIAGVDDEELSAEELEEIYTLEKQLLEFDPNFTMDDTQERQFNYKTSTIHKFLRGPREFDSEDQHQLHQINLNVERIRVPELLFQPSITGIDQAGIIEVMEDTLLRRLPQELGFSGDVSTFEPVKLLSNDIFITGGCSLFPNTQERIANELRAVLPTELNFKVRLAKDPVLDAWRGMSKWAYHEYTSRKLNGFWTKQQYNEYGIHYMTENGFGCVDLS